MINETINLKDFYPLKNDASLTSYCPDNFEEFSANTKRKCILVLPGGAYAYCSPREAEPIALKFLGSNLAAFVLNYSCHPNICYPNPFSEVFAALSYIRRNADKFHIDPDKICLCGFSAGGHLAATCSAICEEEEFAKAINVDLSEIKVNGCILGYPVISKEFGHKESFENFSCGDEALKERFSIEKRITPNYPKTFIWHTTFDRAVNVKNSILLADALAENKVFFEMHIFPYLDHGQSLATKDVYRPGAMSEENFRLMQYNSIWTDLAIRFVKESV